MFRISRWHGNVTKLLRGTATQAAGAVTVGALGLVAGLLAGPRASAATDYFAHRGIHTISGAGAFVFQLQGSGGPGG